MKTRDKILEGARNYLVKHGQAGFTVRAVAAEAEVNPGLVHHYFGSKDNLILSMLEHESVAILEEARRMKAEIGPEGMRKELIGGFFTNLVVGRLFVEAIILSEKSEKVKARLSDLLRSRREYFTVLVGIENPIDKVLMQSVLFGLQLLKKVDPEIDIGESVNRFISKYLVDVMLASTEK